MSNWEVLDQAEAMFGVFDSMGHTPEPMALFQDQEDAERYVKWLTVDAPEDEQLVADQVVICEVHRIAGIVWNHIDPSPADVPMVEDLEL